MDDNTTQSETRSSNAPKGIGRRLATAGWGLFLIWVGASLLMDLGWGVGLIGVAAVILVMQGARRYYGRDLEGFWVAVGVLALFGGVWELFRIRLDLGPVLLIAAGGAMLLMLLRRGSSADGRRPSRHWCGWCRPRRVRRT
jgi:hypothetical protein